MNCVNRSSKEFKLLANHYNLSINALEIVVHKYWMENKTEDYFPSDVYIQAQLGKIPYQEPAKSVRDLWNKQYSAPKEYESMEEVEQAINEAKKFFPASAMHYHQNSNGKYTFLIRKPVRKATISINDIVDRDSYTNQEVKDFEIIARSNNLKAEEVSSQQQDNDNIEQFAIGNRSRNTFTFKDGTTINAPFKPNYQQEDALNAMDEFVKSNKSVMTLSGYAGTGKTSIMQMFAEKMRKNYMPVMFCASTNKAAAVLKEKVSKAGYDAKTLNKIFGIVVEVDPTKRYNARNVRNNLKDPKIEYGTTVIIDEASMINEENYDILKRIAREKGLKIIYVGDPGQLAPVKETQISKVFRDNEGDMRTLSIVERTGDNAILREATNIRNDKPLSGESDFNNEGKGVAYVSSKKIDEINKIIETFTPHLKTDPNYFRILAFHNNVVSSYNTQVRRILGYNDPIPRVGEPITGYSNWGYNWDRSGGTYDFINSEAYKVINVEKPRNISTTVSGIGKVTLEAIPITLENSLGEVNSFNLIDIKTNLANKGAAFKLAKIKSELHNKANKLSAKAGAEYRKAANAIERFLFVNDEIGETINGEFVSYQTKVFDFGYSMTVHKSQGSTFKHVLIDDVDILSAERNNDFIYDYEDVELEDEHDYENAVIEEMEDVDLGIDDTMFSPEPIPEPTSQPDNISIRQQLEYVAVSRATDTVTIISNNAKKEDSPLNHVKEDSVSEPEQTNEAASNTVTPDEDVWEYMSSLVSPTKSINIQYTPKGKSTQTYTVEGEHIYNKSGKEVYTNDSVDRNKIFANIAIREGRAVIVKHNDRQYVVDNNKQITSVTTGDIMKWGEENGDRKAILNEAVKLFRDRINNVKDKSRQDIKQLTDYLQSIDIDIHTREELIQYLKDKGYNSIQEFIGKKVRPNWEDTDLPFYMTPQGEVYGFAAPNGELYFDETVISYEHPVHEYTHLWDRVVAKNNPDLWKRGIDLMKQTSLWNEVENNDNYGKKWKKANINGSKLESLIASEVHSRLVGRNGEQILDKLAQEKGNKGLVERLKQWLLDFWKDLKATFSNWSEEEINKLTLQDFVMMTVRDFADGINPNNTINQDNNSLDNKIEYDNDFRRVQEESARMAQEELSQRHSGERILTKDDKQRLAVLYGRLVSRANGGSNERWSLTAAKSGNTFNVVQTDSSLFHDIFEINRRYLPNGELVDLHDDYKDCKCFITDDGLCGFAIEPDGNLISVFSLWGNDKKGFLHAVKDFAIEQGATHLDAYNSNKQPLRSIYEKVFGAKVASSMDYNMEFNHDDIAKNHGEPQVVFMVMGKAADKDVEERHFNKDQYDEAVEYQQSFLTSEEQENNTYPRSVSLPSYEYFNDLYEDTEVDAEWKVPMLKDLDEQLTKAMEEYEETKNTENSQRIADRMRRILEANTPEDLQDKQQEEPEVNERKEKNLSEYDKLINQLNNLLDSDIISASDIRHTAELVVNSISDTITILQTEKGKAVEFFPNIDKDFDFLKASRREIVEKVGINNLVNRAKQQFDPEQNDYDFDVMEQADLIVDNWDAILMLASDVFSMNEGFGVYMNYDSGNFDIVEGTNIGYDNFNNEGQDTESIEETEGDEQEHWQVESRTIDILNSMSALVRQGLHQCYQIDKDGNKVMSKWGIAERINPRQAVNSILRWTQGALTLDDMINKLTSKSEQNPWLEQLIQRLSDKSGNETDFQSQFFGVFSKHFQSYSIVLKEKGVYKSIPVNSHPALSEVISSISTQYRIGEHPLFTDKGINIKYLGTKETVKDSDDFNLHKALANLNGLVERLNHNESETSIYEEAAENIIGVCKIMGYPISDEMLDGVLNKDNIKKMAGALGYIVTSLDSAVNEKKRNPNAEYDPFAYNTDNNIGGSLRNFLSPITDKLEDIAINAFYDSGKMYQSYITPSFMTKLMKKFSIESEEEFTDFIMEEYGNSEWFKQPSGGNIRTGWRNEWLRLLATNENARKVFDHKVELNFNKHNYMRNMSDAEYTLSLITEYFAETPQKGQAMVPAWFRIPMLSNKPSSEFIKFLSYRGSNYKTEIVRGLHSMYLQELSRIQTVMMRGYSKNDPNFIKNFDSNGLKFNFLPFLNSYLEDTAEARRGRHLLLNEDGSISDANDRLAELLQTVTRGNIKLSSEDAAELNKLVDEAITNHMQERADEILDRWEKNGILEAAKKINNIGDKEAIKASVENFLWNDCFASKNILQLTITDIAFYKDTEDLQKRLAQLHSPGIRGNVNATDYKGNRVSDGTYRTVILEDFDSFKSNIIANISEVFDRKIAAAPEGQKAQLRALKDDLVRPPLTHGKDDKGGKYWNINVTDAQGYSSPASYRKKAFIFGRWSKQAEDIYQNLLNGDYDYTTLEIAFQPLKPFVYTHLKKDMGVDNAPIKAMNVPFQAKNAEYLLIMADALIQSEVKKSGELSRPNLLRAVYRVMEDSEKLNPTKGIDTIQFESAIKSGLQGKMDIHQFINFPNGEEDAYNYMMNRIYKLKDDNTRSSEYNTDTYVHEAPYEDYCLQQEVPEHFKDHSQSHGSQVRMITPSDLDMYKNPNGSREDELNFNYYEWTDPDGTKRKVRADEFRREYEETIAANIRESIDDLARELHFNSSDKVERNIALSKILQREILSSPRYGVDLIQACSIDKETGEFRIPKGDPIQAKRIEQLINSIIKNRVNKQKIAGGPIVQVSNFGTSKQLHIRFNAKSGGLLLMEEEFTPTDKYKTYSEYKKAEQAGIAYFEVFIPIWANEVFEKFSNSDGTINVEAIKATDPELLKMVSYRIPTEDKYSCAPMKVVGFMPKEAGNALMLPYELTEIDDSDFDVDKRYVMRKDLVIKKKKSHIIRKELFNIATKSYKAKYGKELPDSYADEIEMFLDSPETMKDKNTLNKWLYSNYQRIAYYTEQPNKKKQRDNKIVDMTYAVLTNEKTADKILNPGGFDGPKRMGYAVAAYKNPANDYIWEELQNMRIDDLKDACYTEKDLTWADTQVQFYKQNAAAASLIGVFAVNKVAHATLEGNDILLAVNEFCGDNPFSIAGMTFGGYRDSFGNALMSEDEYKKWQKEKGLTDITYKDYLKGYVMQNADDRFTGRMYLDQTYDKNGNLIGKTLGSLVSASADAVKDPILNLMNINMSTAAMLNTLLRLGMPFDDAALFLSQNVIENVLNEFNRENLTNYVSLSSIISKRIDAFASENNISPDSTIYTEPLTKDELVEGLTAKEHDVIDFKVLLAFQKIKKLSDAVKKPTFATRFNSVSSAVGPLIVDNLIIEHKMEEFLDGMNDDGTGFYTSEGITVDIDDVFADHPVLKQFARTVDIAKAMFMDMPAGSVGFRNLISTLPENISEKVFNDKKLLDDLSNFYQSYLLVASGLINPDELKDYIGYKDKEGKWKGFPKEFSEQNIKEQYPDNALIQAIKMNVSKNTGRPYLTINITGLDEAQKEIYRSAWIDLHKDNPELSKKLFNYCFFRAGIGFSPKTFMSLVPTYVKERLSTELPDGSTTTYVDTYRKFPPVSPSVVIDQWVRNNWDDNTIVPKRGGEGTNYVVDIDSGMLYVRDPKDMDDVKDLAYMKTDVNNNTYLWKNIGVDQNTITFKMVKPLGNNGEYFEISLSDIKDPLSLTTATIENNDSSDLKTQSPQESDAASDSKTDLVSDKEKSIDIDKFADGIMALNPRYNKTEALNKIGDIKSNTNMYAKFIQNVFKQMGLEFDKEEAIKKFKEMC